VVGECPVRLAAGRNTGLFLVYTDTRALDNLFPGPARTDRAFVLKFSRTFDLLQ
jgi:hypothetical protein